MIFNRWTQCTCRRAHGRAHQQDSLMWTVAYAAPLCASPQLKRLLYTRPAACRLNRPLTLLLGARCCIIIHFSYSSSLSFCLLSPVPRLGRALHSLQGSTSAKSSHDWADGPGGNVSTLAPSPALPVCISESLRTHTHTHTHGQRRADFTACARDAARQAGALRRPRPFAPQREGEAVRRSCSSPPCTALN